MSQKETVSKPISYFELRTPDPSQAERFFGELFGWRFEPVPGMSYDMLRTGGELAGGVMPTSKSGGPPLWLPYLSVDDLDATVARTLKLGGKVLQGRTEVPQEGWFAVITDPTGAPLAFWQDAHRKG